GETGRSATFVTHQLDCRVKKRDSLEKKIVKKNFKYKKLDEITDLVGFRAITYFEDDIEKIADLIRDEFDIDIKNSIDKRQLETDKFGYRSLHFVLSLKQERLKLTEYKRFLGLKAEIQIRSILQHSWAEIEHDLGYKGESEIPLNAKRTFYRVAALLEQADIEFVKLKALIAEHQQDVREQIKANPDSVIIDKTSLLSFIKENPILRDTELKVQNEGLQEDDKIPDSVISNALPRLKKLNITTIKILEDLYKKHKTDIINYISEKFPHHTSTSQAKFATGASVLWLCGFLEKK
ncbi:MAG: (p)ppGpp synthetase, partial [Bacteroidetes bacterium]|nr:(p)ppGpp synthetase [Bacteroidota bacterium]